MTATMSDQCLGLVFQALSGRTAFVQRVDSSEPATFPDTWSALRLGSFRASGEVRGGTRAWEKVCVAHRAGHYREGTFALSVNGRPGYFKHGLGGLAEVPRQPPETQWEVFFRLFSRPRLALRVFTALEDLRIDERARSRYPGLRDAYDDARQLELAARLPAAAGGGPRRKMLEVLVRLSLGQAEDLLVPAAWAGTGSLLAGLTQVMRLPTANVHDTAIATLAAYEALDALPTLGPNDDVILPWAPVAPVDLVPALLTAPGVAVQQEGDEVLDVEVVSVSFRDSLDARVWSYAQPSRLRESIYRISGGQPGPGTPNEHEGHDHHDAEQGEKRGAQREPLPHEHTEVELMPVEPAHVYGPLTGENGAGYTYPEWDAVRSVYLPNHCRVREFVPAQRRPGLGGDALQRIRGKTLQHAREMLAGLQPERVRLTPGHEDGDEIDLDAAVDAFVDRRAGLEPSERLYLRSEAVERDVCFGVLVDLSMSTSDPLRDAADLRPSECRRVLDVEKDSLLLLLQAMELVGDASAAYGFSGSGRGDVRLAVVKEPRERLRSGVLGRLVSLKPMHMTRMGAAVRHVTARLVQEQQTTKYLLLISDGRPYDHEYGQQYGDETALTYAVADTHKALLEAVAAGVRPVVLTVDRSGEDYLREMCGDLEYQVIDRAEDLPTALLSLYRRLADQPS